MFLRAGALSLGLLIASRFLGLARESALAAAFGASGTADVAVLMLTLPDWFAGLLASGALAYVLVPAWASQTQAEVAAGQRRLTRWIGVLGAAAALVLIAFRGPVAHILAPGVSEAFSGSAAVAMTWSAIALPGALLAALWTTRLQHERDFPGMYGANLVVNVMLVVAIGAAAVAKSGIALLGTGLLAAMFLRLGWLAWRTPRVHAVPNVAPVLPTAALWVWAALAAGLPLALPFVARSIASQGGPGGLATFNYAWKLVELPLVLAVQLVASIAFPMVARAQASGDDAETARAVRTSLALAWTLACAAAAGLVVAAPAIAQLLFGWGRMRPEALANVAHWGALGAWSLLPQAVIAVALTVLASQKRLHAVVWAYGAALVILLAAGLFGMHDGAHLMLLLDAILAGVSVGLLLDMRASRGSLPLPCIAAALAALVVAAALATMLPPLAMVAGLLAGLAAAAFVLASAWAASSDVRMALAR